MTIPIVSFTAIALIASGLTVTNTILDPLPDAYPIASVTSLASGLSFLYITTLKSPQEMYYMFTYLLMLVNPLYILQYASAIGASGYYYYTWPLAVQSVFLAITGGAALVERYVWKTPRWLWSAFVHVGILLMYYATGSIMLYRINENNAYSGRYMYGPVIAFALGNLLLPLAVLTPSTTTQLTLLSCMFLFCQVAFNIVLVVYFNGMTP